MLAVAGMSKCCSCDASGHRFFLCVFPLLLNSHSSSFPLSLCFTVPHLKLNLFHQQTLCSLLWLCWVTKRSPTSHGGDGQQTLPTTVEGPPWDGDVLHQLVWRERGRSRPPPFLHLTWNSAWLHSWATPHPRFPSGTTEQLQPTPTRYHTRGLPGS